MASGAGKMKVRCVFSGSLSMSNMRMEQRPYHRDCSCSLHELEGLLPAACYAHGMDVVSRIASFPTYKPGERVHQYNDLADFYGDERAKTARAIWDKPQETLYISNCGELKVTKPTLSPSLP